jgi:hypothetical protein
MGHYDGSGFPLPFSWVGRYVVVLPLVHPSHSNHQERERERLVQLPHFAYLHRTRLYEHLNIVLYVRVNKFSLFIRIGYKVQLNVVTVHMLKYALVVAFFCGTNAIQLHSNTRTIGLLNGEPFESRRTLKHPFLSIRAGKFGPIPRIS